MKASLHSNIGENIPEAGKLNKSTSGTDIFFLAGATARVNLNLNAKRQH